MFILAWSASTLMCDTTGALCLIGIPDILSNLPKPEGSYDYQCYRRTTRAHHSRAPADSENITAPSCQPKKRWGSVMNCSPGNLAIIIKEDPGCEINIGRIVIVSAKGANDVRFGWTWVIKPLDQSPMLAINDETEVVGIATSDIYQPDDWLQPIKFDEVDYKAQSTSAILKIEVSQ